MTCIKNPNTDTETTHLHKIMRIQNSGGTGSSSVLVSKTMRFPKPGKTSSAHPGQLTWSSVMSASTQPFTSSIFYTAASPFQVVKIGTLVWFPSDMWNVCSPSLSQGQKYKGAKIQQRIRPGSDFYYTVLTHYNMDVWWKNFITAYLRTVSYIHKP